MISMDFYVLYDSPWKSYIFSMGFPMIPPWFPWFSRRAPRLLHADADAEGLGPDGLDQEGGGRGGGEGRCGLFTRNTLHYMK